MRWRAAGCGRSRPSSAPSRTRPIPADDKLERLLLALASMQREVLARDPHLFAVHRDATVESRPIARRHRGRLRQLVERVIEEGMNAGTFSLRDRERGIAFIFDTSHRFLHPVSIQLDAEVPRDLIEARSGRSSGRCCASCASARSRRADKAAGM